MIRRAALVSRVGLQRRTPLARRTQLRPVSKARQRQRRDYEQAKAEVWARDGGHCQPGLLLRDGKCTLEIHPHHIWTQRQYPKLRCDPDVMVCCCSYHHRLIHDNPKWAKRAGWLK